MALTEKQVVMIEHTWSLVKVDLQSTGTTMFLKLFDIAPDLQELFPFKDQEVSEENESLKKHAMQVMESIDKAIALLHDPDELVSVLTELGIMHNLHNVQVKSFAPVGEALLYALEIRLKEQFTAEVKAAWVTLYATVQHYMELGMSEGFNA